MEKKFTFSFEFKDGYCGYFVRADNIPEAVKGLLASCKRDGANPDDYMLFRIQEGDSDGSWIWDLYRDVGRDNFPHHLKG